MAVQQDREYRLEGASHFKYGGQEGLTEKTTFEPRLEGSEGVHHVKSGRRVIQADQVACAKY